MDDVEAREHGGSEIVVLRGCRPVVGVGKHREDDLEGVVAEFFERKEASLDAVGYSVWIQRNLRETQCGYREICAEEFFFVLAYLALPQKKRNFVKYNNSNIQAYATIQY